MKQSLHLRLGQQLTMTPQLQQAIKLLQLSTLDLQQEIQQALDSNMMLELDEEENTVAEQVEAPRAENDYTELSNFNTTSEIPSELGTDSSWEDVYGSIQNLSSSASEYDNDDYLQQYRPTQTLEEHLLWQMELTPFSEQDKAIATAIIDAINEDGYLASSIEEIHQGLLSQLEDLDLDELHAVLHRIQQFDPPGIAAMDLADCLVIQLRQLADDTPWKTKALELVTEHLTLLGAQDLNKLCRVLNLSDDELAEVIALIRTLEPKPGSRIQLDEPQYIVPDVFVSRKEHGWVVSINPDTSPALRVNPYYSNLIKRADNSSDNISMKTHLQEARWFIKSLQSRNETLLKVACSIVERQSEFFEFGPRAMKPLVLREVAEEVGMHESTISRVTNQKYMHTPNGVYEFKYFFSSQVATDGGGGCSAIAIKAFIKELIENEDPGKPLSDHSLSEAMNKSGIHVARRTVAKYREAMNISPSNERKRTF